jgi:hypothetical protein
MILNTEMAMRVTTLAKRYDAWLVSIAPLATLADQIPKDTKIDGLTSTEMLRSIEQFSFGVSMNSDLAMAADVVMSNAKAAGEFADTLQMLMGTLQKNSQDQPSVMAALKNVSFGLDGNVVHLGFSVPAAEVERAMRDAMNPKTKTAGPLTASRQPVRDMTPVIQQAQRPQVVPMAQAQAVQPAGPAASGPVIRSTRIPANGEILVQSSPKDMGTVVILGSKK